MLPDLVHLDASGVLGEGLDGVGHESEDLLGLLGRSFDLGRLASAAPDVLVVDELVAVVDQSLAGRVLYADANDLLVVFPQLADER